MVRRKVEGINVFGERREWYISFIGMLGLVGVFF